MSKVSKKRKDAEAAAAEYLPPENDAGQTHYVGDGCPGGHGPRISDAAANVALDRGVSGTRPYYPDAIGPDAEMAEAERIEESEVAAERLLAARAEPAKRVALVWQPDGGSEDGGQWVVPPGVTIPAGSAIHWWDGKPILMKRQGYDTWEGKVAPHAHLAQPPAAPAQPVGLIQTYRARILDLERSLTKGVAEAKALRERVKNLEEDLSSKVKIDFQRYRRVKALEAALREAREHIFTFAEGDQDALALCARIAALFRPPAPAASTAGEGS